MLSPRAERADSDGVKVIYVETCPTCDCALVRSPDGQLRASNRLKPVCTGCACHQDIPAEAPAQRVSPESRPATA